MKNSLAFLFLILAPSWLFSQEVGIEDRVSGINFGIISLSGYSEQKLSDETTLRGEISIFYGFAASNGTYTYAIGPSFSVEPRLYYNIRKRALDQKKSIGNSADFFALDISFATENLVYSNETRSSIYRDINDILSILPTWGMRRQYPNKFVWTISLGVGPAIDFEGLPELFFNYNLEGRIGFVF